MSGFFSIDFLQMYSNLFQISSQIQKRKRIGQWFFSWLDFCLWGVIFVDDSFGFFEEDGCFLLFLLCVFTGAKHLNERRGLES
jgi:hypothetical protein